jgi:uncharacterized protein YdeI (YjbR/CyaY-like superfamily)
MGARRKPARVKAAAGAARKTKAPAKSKPKVTGAKTKAKARAPARASAPGKKKRAKVSAAPARELPTITCVDRGAWATWLAAHHASSRGVWIKLARKSSGIPSVTQPQAVEVALAWGWIDGQGRGLDKSWWLQKFTPRTARSIWSRINREKALAMIAAGEMMPAGLAEVERARSDGRWDAAYESQSRAQVPPDLEAALAAKPRAAAFFSTLDSRNRYAILFRIHGAKKAETRAARIARFVGMLARREKLYP